MSLDPRVRIFACALFSGSTFREVAESLRDLGSEHLLGMVHGEKTMRSVGNEFLMSRLDISRGELTF